MAGGRTGGPADGTAADGSLPTRPPARLSVRDDFPILGRKVRGKRLAYLDSAATAQKPRVVIDALSDFYLRHNANVHRGVHLLGEEATTAFDDARETIRKFINAASTEEIVFTHGTTAGLNMLAQGWAAIRLQPGDEVLLTVMEHHSNIVPWQLAAHRVGAVLKVVPVSPEGVLDLDEYKRLLSSRTRIVAVSHVSNVLGTVAPVACMSTLAHEAGAVVVVDAAQSVPHMKVDVRELDCDFMVFSGHKLYGPMGVGVLYGKRALLDRLPPWQGGGGMIEKVTFEATTWAAPPSRFEAGTPPVAEAVALAAAVDYLQTIGMDRIRSHEDALLEMATRKVSEVPGVRLIGTAPGKTAVLSFVLDDIHPHDLGTILDASGVAVRAGHHCAQPLMRHFRIPATVRASLGVYTDEEDIDQLAGALVEARKRFLG
jgi:cysteine desulfurase/selenocysteine lyase